MEAVLQRLISMVESAAPEVWAVALQQVRAEIVSALMWEVFMLLPLCICIGLFLSFRKKFKAEMGKTENKGWGKSADAENYECYSWVMAALTGGVLAIMVALGTGIAKMVINPQFDAIQRLVNIVQ